MLKPISALLLAATLTSPTMAADFSDKIKQALKSDTRTEQETKRDRNRKPVQTLEFFGIQDNMKVLELIPGGGWYTKLLAPALKDNGQLYVAMGTSRIAKSQESEKSFDKVEILGKNIEFKYNKEEKGYDLTSTKLDVTDLDAVLTFRNYHNLTLKTRTELNDSVYKALKPGGIYGVVDHTRRHMQERNNENGRRFDPVLAIKEIQDAGFEFVDYSKLHYRLDDELRYEVGRKTVTGNTDRFTLLFKKPE